MSYELLQPVEWAVKGFGKEGFGLNPISKFFKFMQGGGVSNVGKDEAPTFKLYVLQSMRHGQFDSKGG